MYLLLERAAMQPARCWERSAQIYWPPTVAVSVIASESPACVFQRRAGSKSKASGLYREYNQGGVAGKRVGCLTDFLKSPTLLSSLVHSACIAGIISPER